MSNSSIGRTICLAYAAILLLLPTQLSSQTAPPVQDYKAQLICPTFVLASQPFQLTLTVESSKDLYLFDGYRESSNEGWELEVKDALGREIDNGHFCIYRELGEPNEQNAKGSYRKTITLGRKMGEWNPRFPEKGWYSFTIKYIPEQYQDDERDGKQYIARPFLSSCRTYVEYPNEDIFIQRLEASLHKRAPDDLLKLLHEASAISSEKINRYLLQHIEEYFRFFPDSDCWLSALDYIVEQGNLNYIPSLQMLRKKIPTEASQIDSHIKAIEQSPQPHSNSNP